MLSMIDGEEVVDLKIPDGATFVSQDAFNSYSGLQSVECAQSVKNIMPGAFFGCKNLKTVTIAGEGMETIWDDAFNGCSSMTSIVLPSTVKEIRKSSFQGCTALSSFSWPENLTLLGDSAFKSDVVKATLCWIDAAPDIVVIDDVAEVEAQPVIIEHVNGLVTVKGVGDGQPVRVYSLAGHQVGAAVSQGSVATVSVGNQKGSVLLVKIGNKTIKVQ